MEGGGNVASHNPGEATSICRLYLPRRRLLVLGVGPVAIQLMRLGQAGGFEVVLQSPDDHTLAAARLSHVETHALPSTAGLVGRVADSRTAIAFVFHDHDREAELLPAALQTKAFYIGALGSHETQRRRLEALRKQGFGSSQLARLHGPAGLLPHARSAFDIALSIVAEIAQAEPRAELLARPAVVSEPLAASAAAG